MGHRQVSILHTLLLLVGCSCSIAPKQIDSQSAVAANDLTALIQGCGQQVNPGYLVCRIPEGSAATESIIIHAPPQLKCNDENACVYFRIYFQDGTPTFEGSVKKGEAFTKIPWSQIINKGTFDLGDRGQYGVSVTIHYKGADGIERKTYLDGYIFMHVVRKDYISLIENEEDENFAWTWVVETEETEQLIKMTTGARIYVSPPIPRQERFHSLKL